MNALVVYDSVFGNTEKVAQEIGAALARYMQVKVSSVGEVEAAFEQGLGLLVVGSPTRSFRPTEAVTNFLNNMPKNLLKDIQIAAFDTRLALETIDSSALRFIVDKGGYAAKTIVKTLEKKGGHLLAPPEGFLVTGEQGPLKDGELERAEKWGEKLFVALRR
jgi:flavodoxin